MAEPITAAIATAAAQAVAGTAAGRAAGAAIDRGGLKSILAFGALAATLVWLARR